MLRILVIAPTMFFADRGCHVRIYEQVRALEKRGHRPTILTYHGGSDIGGGRIERIPRTPWYDKLVAGPSLHFIYMDILLLMKCFHFARKEQIDVIHAHLHEGAFIARTIIKTGALHGVPYLFDAQGSLTGEMAAHGFVRRDSPLFRFWHDLERDIDREAPRIITSSGHLSEMMNDEFGVDPGRITSIPDGVDTVRFRPETDHRNRKVLLRLKGKLGIPEDRVVVVYLGGMDRHKGIGYLLDAIPRILAESQNIHFLIMGYPGEGPVRSEIAGRGLLERVTVTGRVSYMDAPRYLALGDIAISPKPMKWGEANGKLLNYMGSGLPVVAFDHPTNREIMGDAGIYAGMEDPGSLASNIVTLAKDRDSRRKRGCALRDIAKTRYSWDDVASRLEEIYDELRKDTRREKA